MVLDKTHSQAKQVHVFKPLHLYNAGLTFCMGSYYGGLEKGENTDLTWENIASTRATIIFIATFWIWLLHWNTHVFRNYLTSAKKS